MSLWPTCPYVKDADIPQFMPEIRDFEPVAALAGGADGLDQVRLLLAQAKDHLRPRGAVMLEIGLGQADEAVSGQPGGISRRAGLI